MKKVSHLIYKPRFHYYSTLSRVTAISSEVLSIVQSVDPMEPALEQVVPFLSPEIITSVLQEQQNPYLCFRFFVWAAKRKQFRSWGSHNLMINMLVSDNSHLFNAYWKALEEIKSYGLRIPSDAFAVLIAGYWKTKNAEKAMDSFGKMKDFDCQPNLFTYNLILHILVNKGMVLLAFAVYNLMLKLNCHLNCSTYTILIGGFCKSNKTNDAIKLFNEMSHKGIPPSKMTFTAIISGLCREKKINDAYQLFENMKTNGITPDFITYNALLNGVCKLGNMDEAYDLLKNFKKDGYTLDLNGYSSLIDGLFRAQRFKEAHDTFHKMTNNGIKPDVTLYTIMIKGLCNEGRVDIAFKLINEMTDRDLVPDTQTYNTLIKGCCDNGLLDKAHSLTLEISGDTCTYTILISGMCRNGLVDEAQHIFNQMENYGCVPAVITFNALLDGLLKSGQDEKAHKLFYQMVVGRKPSLSLKLAQSSDRAIDIESLQTSVIESGSPLKAYKLLTKLSYDVFPTITTYNIWINARCKIKDLDGALTLFKNLQIKGNKPDSVTYSTLIQGLQSVGRVDEAIKLQKEMENNGCKDTRNVYRTFMKWSCRRNKMSEAFSIWLGYLKTVSNRDEDVLNLVDEHLQKGEIEKPVRLLLDMDIKVRDLDSAPYTIWLIGLCQGLKTTEALKLFGVLREYDVDLTPASCVMLICTLLKEGNVNMAVEVFDYTLQRGFILKPRICIKLIKSLIRAGYLADHVFEVIDKMEYCGYDMKDYLDERTRTRLHNQRKQERQNMVTK